MDPAPGWRQWGPNTDLGKEPQSRSRFPTTEPRDTAEPPSRNAAPKESRGLGDTQGGTGGGSTKPTPQTLRAGVELPGRKGVVGGSAAFPTGSAPGSILCGKRGGGDDAQATSALPCPRPCPRHNNSRECRGCRIRGRSCALGIIYCYPPRQLEQLRRDGAEKGTAAVPARHRGHQTPQGPSPAGLPQLLGCSGHPPSPFQLLEFQPESFFPFWSPKISWVLPGLFRSLGPRW